MKTEFIPLSVPHLRGNESVYVKDCIATEWVSSVGSYVNKFEQGIAERLGSKHAVACVNGTAALHVALLVNNVSSEDEVIVPSTTFIASVNAVSYVGAKPIFIGCDDKLNIDLDKVEQFLSQECDRLANGEIVNKSSGRRVKAIIPVHVFGHPVDMKRLMACAEKYGLVVIEDSAEAIGSLVETDNGLASAGTIGHAGCLSFNGNKLITCGGGGMILFSDENLAKKARHLTTQAKSNELFFEHDEVGFNYRLTNLQAAVGVAQLEQLDKFIEIKKSNFTKYQEGLSGLDNIGLILEPDFGKSNYWYYTMEVKESRDKLMIRLLEKEIGVRPLWAPVHKQLPYVNYQRYFVESSEYYSEHVINLPCSIGLTDMQIARVCDEVRGFYE